MLRTSLKHLYPPQQIEQALLAQNLSPLARGEALSLDQWLQFFNSNSTSKQIQD